MTLPSQRQKVNPLLFAGLISKKGQAKRAFFGVKATNPSAGWVLRWVYTV
jgi:hypothetical protein